MGKSMLGLTRHGAKTIAKGSLYVAGGLALGWPLIVGGKKLVAGESFDAVSKNVIHEGTGYDPWNNKIDSGKVGAVIMRDVVGICAIWAGSKL